MPAARQLLPRPGAVGNQPRGRDTEDPHRADRSLASPAGDHLGVIFEGESSWHSAWTSPARRRRCVPRRPRHVGVTDAPDSCSDRRWRGGDAHVDDVAEAPPLTSGGVEHQVLDQAGSARIPGSPRTTTSKTFCWWKRLPTSMPKSGPAAVRRTSPGRIPSGAGPSRGSISMATVGRATWSLRAPRCRRSG